MKKFCKRAKFFCSREVFCILKQIFSFYWLKGLVMVLFKLMAGFNVSGNSNDFFAFSEVFMYFADFRANFCVF